MKLNYLVLVSGQKYKIRQKEDRKRETNEERVKHK